MEGHSMDERLHYEATPGGGVRVQGGGIELRVSREAMEAAEAEDGHGFNLALTEDEHAALDRDLGGLRGEGSPIENILNFRVQVAPSTFGRDETDEPEGDP